MSRGHLTIEPRKKNDNSARRRIGTPGLIIHSASGLSHEGNGGSADGNPRICTAAIIHSIFIHFRPVPWSGMGQIRGRRHMADILVLPTIYPRLPCCLDARKETFIEMMHVPASSFYPVTHVARAWGRSLPARRSGEPRSRRPSLASDVCEVP